jgi:hypothetical protein
MRSRTRIPPSTHESVVRSWPELNDRLFGDWWNRDLGRFRSHVAYRGVPEREYDLTTSLIRLGGAYADVEAHLLRNFAKYARRALLPDASMWQWLALAQHHGLPTRMLDWTFSPYVALHFATAINRPEQVTGDAVIWAVDFVQTNACLPETLQTMLQAEAADVFTCEMLSHAADSLAAFDRLTPEPFVAFFEAPSLDDRIVNQAALFSLMSSPTARLDHWLDRHPDVYRRIIIPAALKAEVRDKLDQANINERVLFPGLDGLCQWMRRYYAPRPWDEAGADHLPAVADSAAGE